MDVLIEIKMNAKMYIIRERRKRKAQFREASKKAESKVFQDDEAKVGWRWANNARMSDSSTKTHMNPYDNKAQNLDRAQTQYWVRDKTRQTR